MKFWSIFLLCLFINFKFVPVVAELLGKSIIYNLEITNEEEAEEIENSFNKIIEKKIVEPFLLSTIFKFKNFHLQKNNTINWLKKSFHLSPYISIFFPPPDIYCDKSIYNIIYG